MYDFKIDNNIPIPNGTAKKYPFAQMKVNDSFLVTSRVSGAKTQSRKAQNELGFKFAWRKVGDNAARCWRIR